MQIEPFLRLNLNLLNEINPKHEVIRLRNLARRHAIKTNNNKTNPSIHQLFHLLTSPTTTTSQINQQLATVTSSIPLRFILNDTGGTLLHTLLKSSTIDNLKQTTTIAKLLLKLDPTAASVFDNNRQLPLFVLLIALEERHSNDNGICIDCHALVQLVLDYSPSNACEIQCNRRMLYDYFDSNSLTASILIPNRPRQSRHSCSIFDIVRAPYTPIIALRKHLTQYPDAAFDVVDGFFPLETLILFGKATTETINILFSLNPGAVVSSPSNGSLLHLLLGNSGSHPTLEIVKCLCSIDPISSCGQVVQKKQIQTKIKKRRKTKNNIVTNNNTNTTNTNTNSTDTTNSTDNLLNTHETPITTLTKRNIYLKQGRRHTNIDDPNEIQNIFIFLNRARELFLNWKKEQKKVHTIFSVLRKNQTDDIKAAILVELKHASTTPDGMLCADMYGRTPLHLLCSRNVAIHQVSVSVRLKKNEKVEISVF